MVHIVFLNGCVWAVYKNYVNAQADVDSTEFSWADIVSIIRYDIED